MRSSLGKLFLPFILATALFTSIKAHANPVLLHTIDGSTNGESFGDGVSCIPNFSSASGHSDIAIGSPDYPTASSGRAQVVNGSNLTNIFTSNGTFTAARFGYAIKSTLEDISPTPDGIPDLIVGNSSTGYSGSFATVFYSPDGSTSDVIGPNALSSTGSPSGFGSTIAPLRNKRVAIAAPYFEESVGVCGYPSTNCGAFEIFDIASAPFTTSLGSYIDGGNGAEVGFALAAIDDLYGDGESEVIAGGPKKNSSAGQIMVFSSIQFLPGDPTLSPGITINGATAGDEFGTDIAVTNDVNGDSTPDILVGAPQSQTGSGYAVLYAGSNNTSLPTLCTISAPSGAHAFGSSVSALGDIDNDGAPEFAIGAPNQTVGGAVYIYRYNTNSSNCELAYSIIGGNTTQSFGRRVSGAIPGQATCDLNSDGTADFLVTESADGAATGRVYAYAGVAVTPTPTPTPTPSDRTARIQYRISTDGIFRAHVVVEPAPSPSCNLVLYGRRTNRTLEQRSRTVRLIDTTIRSRASQFVARELPKVAGNDQVILHLIARVTCGEQTTYSNVKSRYLRACGSARYGSVTPAKWERQLKSKLANAQ